jgi:5-methylcytosine-specific restriction endonuclease McrA
MSYVTALLPMQQGVAVFKALSEAAGTHRSQHAEGDDRTRDQVMADTLVERVTGQSSAPAVPIEVSIVISDDALFDTGEGDACDEPAEVVGYGPVPGDLLREWLQADAPTWLRRVYTRPSDGALVAMDSHHRLFEGKLRDFVTLRDRVCRTPWCGAPIRHVDHPVSAARGGGTTAANSQGLCEACNYIKEGPAGRPAWLPTARCRPPRQPAIPTRRDHRRPGTAVGRSTSTPHLCFPRSDDSRND